jgi:hypothetical protein
VLARHGSTDQPERFEPQLALLSRRRADGTAAVESPRRPWYRTWWFWTAVGAVVLGGATAAVVLTLPEEQQSGSLGTGRLE